MVDLLCVERLIYSICLSLPKILVETSTLANLGYRDTWCPGLLNGSVGACTA